MTLTRSGQDSTNARVEQDDGLLITIRWLSLNSEPDDGSRYLAGPDNTVGYGRPIPNLVPEQISQPNAVVLSESKAPSSSGSKPSCCSRQSPQTQPEDATTRALVHYTPHLQTAGQLSEYDIMLNPKRRELVAGTYPEYGSIVQNPIPGEQLHEALRRPTKVSECLGYPISIGETEIIINAITGEKKWIRLERPGLYLPLPRPGETKGGLIPGTRFPDGWMVLVEAHHPTLVAYIKTRARGCYLLNGPDRYYEGLGELYSWWMDDTGYFDRKCRLWNYYQKRDFVPDGNVCPWNVKKRLLTNFDWQLEKSRGLTGEGKNELRQACEKLVADVNLNRKMMRLEGTIGD